MLSNPADMNTLRCLGCFKSAKVSNPSSDRHDFEVWVNDGFGAGMRNVKAATAIQIVAEANPDTVDESAERPRLTSNPPAIHPYVAHTRSGPNSRLGSGSFASTSCVVRPQEGAEHKCCNWIKARIHPGCQLCSIAQNVSVRKNAIHNASRLSRIVAEIC